MPPPWDLLIRGGTLVDPAAERDIAFSEGKGPASARTAEPRRQISSTAQAEIRIAWDA